MPRTRSRRVAVNTVCALLAAAAATVALRPSLLTDRLPDGLIFFGTQAVDTLPLPAGSERGPSPAAPFRGSPALR